MHPNGDNEKSSLRLIRTHSSNHFMSILLKTAAVDWLFNDKVKNRRQTRRWNTGQHADKTLYLCCLVPFHSHKPLVITEGQNILFVTV